jgi:prepilin-type N-terminal cleavage/methylation domain-containing protein
MRYGRGFTILEVMMAMVILTIVFLVTFTLLHTAIRHMNTESKDVTGLIVAERWSEEIHKWAWQKSDGVHYNFNSTWSTYSGLVTADSENADYTVSIKVRDHTIYGPSTSTVELIPEADKRKFTGSCRMVKITVSWDPTDVEKRVSIHTIIREPPRKIKLIEVTAPSGIPVPIYKDQTVTFNAAGKDMNDETINDLCFKWYVIPMTGTGTVSFAGNGKSAVFTNKHMKPDGNWYGSGGACKVWVRAVQSGIEKSAYAPADLELNESSAP